MIMPIAIYVGDVETESWDDSTEMYTRRDLDGNVVETRPYTANEIQQKADRETHDAQITDLQARVEALEAYVFRVTPPTDEGDWSADGTYPPGAVVTYDGHSWVNQTGAWLNGNYEPGDPLHPFWSQQPNPGDTPVPWAEGMHLTTGLFVSNSGHVYQWAQAEVAAAPANYAPTGTVSTAAWTFIS